jgi:hypothetical protein
LEKKESWLNKYAGEIDDVVDVGSSGSFEKMERQFNMGLEAGA